MSPVHTTRREGREFNERGGSSVEQRFSTEDDGESKQLHPHLARGSTLWPKLVPRDTEQMFAASGSFEGSHSVLIDPRIFLSLHPVV